ncbi:MAG: HD-GYP domain-containing protein [Planctomycetota bacterium]|jgi:HD-GYP domain-containing protein (c-di-GMP phosphodiesterase class II)
MEPDHEGVSIFKSRAFQIEAVRSEHTRIRWTLVTFAAIVLFAAGRDLLFRYEGWLRNFSLVIILGAGVLAYEAIMYVLVGRYVRGRQALPELVWRANTVVEALFPTLVLMVLTLLPDVGPYTALTMPAIALYYLAIILATMRLRPSLCLLSGGVAAVGYATLIVYTFAVFPERPDDAGRGATYATGAAFMFIAGAVGAAVAGKIRSYLAVALHEAAERQRARLEGRNTLIFGLAKLAEYRDTDTGAHLARISAYSALLAGALRGRFAEIDDDWIETIRVAASMHDIGKVGIPDNVLQKPGRLTEDERSVMERHPGIGADTLRSIQEKHGEDALLQMSDEIAVSHHERWDGTGYPRRIAGGEISVAARIISVADVYDALTSARVYKPALSHEEACRIIRAGRGTQFDPTVVDAFLEIAERFDEVRRRHAT